MKNINSFTFKKLALWSTNIDLNENVKILLTENGTASEKVNYIL